jgi:PAS domain S-box-containing protein
MPNDMNTQISRSQSIGLALILLLLLIIAGVSSWNTRLLHENNRWVAHTHEVISAIDLFLLTLQEADSGQKAYLITGNAAYLEPYRTGASKVQLQIDQLRKLTADNPGQRARISVLEERIAARFGELQRIIGLHDEQGFAQARDAVLEGTGKREMEAIQAQVAEMKNVENDLLVGRRKQAQTSYRIGLASEIIAGLLGAALVLLAWYLLRRDFFARLRASEVLAATRQQIDETRALLQILMASAPVGIAFLDREMRYRSINAHLAEIDGISVEAHIGRTAAGLRSIPANAEGLFRQVIETKKSMLNLELYGETPKSPGVQKVWLQSWFLVSSEDGKEFGVGLIVQDITERKRVEEQLRLSEERYRLAIDAAELGTFYCPAPLGPIFWNTTWRAARTTMLHTPVAPYGWSLDEYIMQENDITGDWSD